MKALLALALLPLLSLAGTPIHADGIWKLEFPKGGNLFLTAGGDGCVGVWQRRPARKKLEFCHPRDFQVYDAHFLPGRRVISTSLDGTIFVWSLDTGEKLHEFTEHEEYSSRIVVRPDGKLILTLGADDVIKAWDSDTYELKFELKTKSPVGAVFSGNDYAGLLTAGLHGLALWDLKTFAQAKLSASPYSFSLAPLDPGFALVGGSASGGEPCLRAIEIGTGKTQVTYEKADTSYFQIAVSPNGRFVAASGYRGTVSVWDRYSGKLLARSPENEPTLSVAFYPMGRRVLIGTLKGELRWMRF